MRKTRDIERALYAREKMLKSLEKIEKASKETSFEISRLRKELNKQRIFIKEYIKAEEKRKGEN